MSNKRICVEATQRGQVKKWETNPKFLKFVDEAKLRNLDCNVVTETIVNFPDLRQVPLVRKFDIDVFANDRVIFGLTHLINVSQYMSHALTSGLPQQPQMILSVRQPKP